MLDSLTLMQMGAPMRAAMSLIGQLVVGLLVTYLGFNLGLRL